jgi:hypothetical protein
VNSRAPPPAACCIATTRRSGSSSSWASAAPSTLSAIDEAWQKIKLTEGSSDVKVIPQGARTRFEVNMNRRVGFVGGAAGAAAGNPAANYIVIIVQKGREIVTAFPWTP